MAVVCCVEEERTCADALKIQNYSNYNQMPTQRIYSYVVTILQNTLNVRRM